MVKTRWTLQRKSCWSRMRSFHIFLLTHGYYSESGPGFRCHWDGCTYSRPFVSAFTLERHVQDQHINPNQYKCPESDCYRAFGRKDKLNEYSAVHSKTPKAWYPWFLCHMQFEKSRAFLESVPLLSFFSCISCFLIRIEEHIMNWPL